MTFNQNGIKFGKSIIYAQFRVQHTWRDVLIRANLGEK
jgi:hypothetical protein